MRKDPSYLSRMHMDVLDAHDRAIDPASVDWSGAHTPNFTVRRGSRLLQPGGQSPADDASGEVSESFS
jgi:murein L,D-transpeptidase YcbB/YkuD